MNGLNGFATHFIAAGARAGLGMFGPGAAPSAANLVVLDAAPASK